MKAQTAYESYRETLNYKTRNWHELKTTPLHIEKTEGEFNDWVFANKRAELNKYFMGEYVDMPHHTQAGWEAFADNVENGPEFAWNSYADTARTNYHLNNNIVLPRYSDLDPDQKIALENAVNSVLEMSAGLRL